MNVLAQIKARFRTVLATLCDEVEPLLEMIRAAQDPRFGDYQANCAMPLQGRLGTGALEIAQQIVDKLDMSDFCQPLEIVKPGFINIRIKDDWLIEQMQLAWRDTQRLGVSAADVPRKFIIDYSSPNVAKPMHVGHIRSTVIGDSLYRILGFLGHTVVSDNHLGDWGLQFGKIIYGYKHLRDADRYQSEPVTELGRLYKLVHELVEYHKSVEAVPELQNKIQQATRELEQSKQAEAAIDRADKKAAKRAAKSRKKTENRVADAQAALSDTQKRIEAIERDPRLAELAAAHPGIVEAVNVETAKLHQGDAENFALWQSFMPPCRQELDTVYARLGIQFDAEHGESFYHDMLADVVDELKQHDLQKASENGTPLKLATESNGAICVFLDQFETPMIVQKSDGAFLYATTDLATIRYRIEHWQPSAILYVVDHRQSEHFQKLFAVARLWGYADVELQHVSFGTVTGPDGKPFKTRDGDVVSLESLLDQAVDRAYQVVCENDTKQQLNEEQRRQVSSAVGLGAIKYADLSHNRESDYVFSYDKMMSLRGNTATYMQYSYARICSIFTKCGIDDIAQFRDSSPSLELRTPHERKLALAIMRFSEALAVVAGDYRPNHLTNYLYDELAKAFSQFFDKCPVRDAETPQLRESRLLLCDMAGRTIRQGLSLLGIDVVERL